MGGPPKFYHSKIPTYPLLYLLKGDYTVPLEFRLQEAPKIPSKLRLAVGIPELAGDWQGDQVDNVENIRWIHCSTLYNPQAALSGGRPHRAKRTWLRVWSGGSGFLWLSGG